MDIRVKVNYFIKILLEKSSFWFLIDLERFKIENNSFKVVFRGSDVRRIKWFYGISIYL